MREGSLFEDFLYLLKARNEDAVLVKAIIFAVLNKKERKGEKLDDLRDRLSSKSLEELFDVTIYNLASRREAKHASVNLDDGRLYHGVYGKDRCEYDLFVTLDDLIHYELKVSTAWTEKPKQDYARLELSKKTDAIEFFEDLKILGREGVNFGDIGKILDRKYRPLTLYKPQPRTHYLEGVLSAQPGYLSDNSDGKRDVVDYCVSLEISQTKNNNKPNDVIAVLTIDTKWNFIKK